MTEHCGNPNPHGPHTYYGPAKKGSKQEQYYCPGTK